MLIESVKPSDLGGTIKHYIDNLNYYQLQFKTLVITIDWLLEDYGY